MNCENIVMNKTICDSVFEAKVGTDIIVPDSQPDVLEVICAQVFSSVGESYISKDKITVSGYLNCNVIYRSDEETPRVCSINYKLPYSQQFDVKNVNDEADLCVTSKVCHVDVSAPNSRKVNVEATLLFDILLTQYYEEEISILCDDEPCSKTKQITSYNNVICEKSDFVIEHTVGINGAVSLLNCCAEILSKDIKVINNKVVVKGTAKISLLYLTENFVCGNNQYSVDFTEVIDVKDIDPQMLCRVDLNVKDVDVNFVNDLDVANAEICVIVSAKVCAYDEYKYTVLCDAYSPQYEVSLEKKLITFKELIRKETEKISLTEYVDVSKHNASSVYNVYAYPKTTSAYIDNGKINIEGFVNVTVLYFSSDDLGLYSSHKKIPFAYCDDIKTDALPLTLNANATIDNIFYNLNVSGEAEVKISLDIEFSVIKENTNEIITSIDVDKSKIIDKSDISSLTIYFVQKGDTLWDIAKKYHTTTQKISSINGIDENKILMPGERLLIPKK